MVSLSTLQYSWDGGDYSVGEKSEDDIKSWSQQSDIRVIGVMLRTRTELKVKEENPQDLMVLQNVSSILVRPK